jgi:hypothetical protein
MAAGQPEPAASLTRREGQRNYCATMARDAG